jgi:BirA family biotin operon repressor/biotin-[acetyl-CoA-carboxylase] ligase
VKAAIRDGEKEGLVVTALTQGAGYGRTGHEWKSPLGGLYFSMLLRPEVPMDQLPTLSQLTSYAIREALSDLDASLAEAVKIKWPNDVLIDGKKVCGILTESVTKSNTIENVIIGVGIDANLETSQFPAELQKITTTLKEKLGKECDENLLIKIFLEEFEKISKLFNHEEYEAILKEWRKRSYTIGKTVEVKKPFNTNFDAYVLGIDRDGALIVEKNDGTIEKVISGECIVKN